MTDLRRTDRVPYIRGPGHCPNLPGSLRDAEELIGIPMLSQLQGGLPPASPGVHAYIDDSSVPNALMFWDAAGQIYRSAGRRVLTGDKTYYVSPAGSDTTGDGSASKPWRNIWYAWLWLSKNIDLGGNCLTIKLAPGTYVGGFSCYGTVDTPPYDQYFNNVWPLGLGTIRVTGDVDAPQNYIVVADAKTNWSCFEAALNPSIFTTIEGVWLKGMPGYAYATAFNGDRASGSLYKCIIGEVGGDPFGYGAYWSFGNCFTNNCEWRGSFDTVLTANPFSQVYGNSHLMTGVTVASQVLYAHNGYIGLFSPWTGTVTGKKGDANFNGIIQNAHLVTATIAATSNTGGQIL